MVKSTSTRMVIELLQEYEKEHGVGSITSIGTVCSGDRTVEYIFHVRDKARTESSVEIPSMDENVILEKNQISV